MKASTVLVIPVIACLFTSCLTPAYRDKDFFYEDRSADRFGGDDPYADLDEARGKKGPTVPGPVPRGMR
jgi:hypothetical protein